MKNERFQTLIAILLVPVLLAGIVAFCKLEVQTATRSGTWKYPERYDYDESDVAVSDTLEAQGYTLYQPVPEQIKNLHEQRLFKESVTVENRGGEMDIDEEPDEDIDGDIDEDIDDEEEVEISLEKLENGQVLKEFNTTLVGCADDKICLSAELSFDQGNSSFAPGELAEIEACGFPGFADKMQEIAKLVIQNEEECGDDIWEYGEYFHYYNRGVEFSVRRASANSFTLMAWISVTSCYGPAKYQEFIQNVTEDGEYFLYSTCVGAETDVITFCKNNTFSCASRAMTEKCKNACDDKKITCMFRDGKLYDYYVAACGNELKLDEADQAFFDTYTKGLGKTLSQKASMFREGIYRVYRTK
ncbi:MAG: hypothetical protein NC293_05290 [Roseburia sp.]|nr:hypothetical protein [Roseburia sp.]